ncbi:MAG: tRNA-specific adenosine deaminase [Flavobacteriales bacterium]|nr:tRNA-specific adenosine deaminase [Flavobacteriales bacterium]|tara:strand:+ start:33498 stop:33947 length:450 start_codon:yes stop_codon:yes gene_type:complete
MSLSVFSDEHFMKLAYQEAEKAFDLDEVPVGAVIVCDNQVIAKAHNLTEALNDVTAHAEMQAFTMAANYLGGKFLDSCTLYVTLEPCSMCAGAAYWTRIKRVVIGAADEKRGFRANNPNMMHPKTTIEWGVMENECSSILKEFFERKRT